MTVDYKTGLPATGDLRLQVCSACGQVNYPSRELCGNCLADALHWQAVDAEGTVQSLTELHYSLEEDYAQRLPWRVASVKLDCGPIALAHLEPGVSLMDRVIVRVVSDRYGNPMLAALDSSSDNVADWLETIDFREDFP